MQFTSADGRKLRLTFHHERFDTAQPPMEVLHERAVRPGSEVPVRGRTVCIIKEAKQPEGEPDDTAIVSEATSWCSSLDQFDKEKGRQTALHRAVEKLDRETRGAALKAYFERTQRGART